ncbi:tRNA(Ile)-lysidine synthase [Limimonas halophila]|uniref:tRNA(Ile)-lysidine synthase n=1 Tax=Limimonas halophila TaxID=1082479 RepID=A0A1G7M0D8_9PROT|nr:tRNA lysidine(34) synthetase TilS [Limimonas halophila]SDF55143.1 tRNA(Ile)-lysidine synthase [Limimonas halophila]
MSPDPGRVGTAEPLGPDTFDSLMAPLAPDDARAPIGVAVSGGADSLALLTLLADWAVADGRLIHAFTVDHGLRAEAAAEARWVGEVCAAHRIPHTILHPDPALSPDAGQAAIREARYAALIAACRDAGLADLALAHHLNDQAETVLLRVRAETGPAGLAGMPAVRRRDGVRLIRPLLPVARARLEATLRARGLNWVRDPSNADRRFTRTRVRHAMPALAEAGLDAATLAEIAHGMGRARQVVETACTELLAGAARLEPSGYAVVDAEEWGEPPLPLARDALARLICAVGGRTQAPRAQRLDRLAGALAEGFTQARTLGGCRIVPHRNGWLVVREVGRTPATPLEPGRTTRVDGRFTVRLSPDAPDGLVAAPLGHDGWVRLTADAPSLRATAVPPPARPALMAVRDEHGPRHVPDLGWTRADAGAGELAAWCHSPACGLAPPAFTVAPRPVDIMSRDVSHHGGAAPGRAGRETAEKDREP